MIAESAEAKIEYFAAHSLTLQARTQPDAVKFRFSRLQFVTLQAARWPPVPLISSVLLRRLDLSLVPS